MRLHTRDRVRTYACNGIRYAHSKSHTNRVHVAACSQSCVLQTLPHPLQRVQQHEGRSPTAERHSRPHWWTPSLHSMIECLVEPCLENTNIGCVLRAVQPFLALSLALSFGLGDQRGGSLLRRQDVAGAARATTSWPRPCPFPAAALDLLGAPLRHGSKERDKVVVNFDGVGRRWRCAWCATARRRTTARSTTPTRLHRHWLQRGSGHGQRRVARPAVSCGGWIPCGCGG